MCCQIRSGGGGIWFLEEAVVFSDHRDNEVGPSRPRSRFLLQQSLDISQGMESILLLSKIDSVPYNKFLYP